MSLQKYQWSMLFNISVSERYIRYIYGKNQHETVEGIVKVRAKQIDLLFNVKRWNLLHLFLLYDRLMNVSVSLFYTLVFFRNIQFSLLADTYWLPKTDERTEQLWATLLDNLIVFLKSYFCVGALQSTCCTFAEIICSRTPLLNCF